MKSDPRDFIYITQNILDFTSQPTRALHVNEQLHWFCARYAQSVLNIQLPYPQNYSAFVKTKNTRRIGKALQTHEDSNFSEFHKDIERRDLRPRIILDLKDLFLFGGDLEIIGTKEGHHQQFDINDSIGDAIAQQRPAEKFKPVYGDYNVIYPSVTEQDLHHIRFVAEKYYY